MAEFAQRTLGWCIQQCEDNDRPIIIEARVKLEGNKPFPGPHLIEVVITPERAREIASWTDALTDQGERYYGLHGKGWSYLWSGDKGLRFKAPNLEK